MTSRDKKIFSIALTLFLFLSIGLITLQEVSGSEEPELVDTSISRNGWASPGDTRVLGFKIRNPTSQDLDVGLGATIRTSESSDDYSTSDEPNDKIVTVPAGTTGWYYRDFDIPSDAHYGEYDVAYGLWPENPGEGIPHETVWKNGLLTIAEVSIQSFDVEEGTRNPGEIVRAEASIRNEGTKDHTFNIEYMIRDSAGRYIGVYNGEKEVPAGGTITLDDELIWIVDEDAATGEATGRLRVIEPGASFYYTLTWDHEGFEIRNEPINKGIEITSDPTGGEVWEDGTDWGDTPITLWFEAGSTHTVTVKKSGYQDLTKTITADADKTVHFSLEPINKGPSADFTYSPNLPTTADTVSFDASSSSDLDGDISDYAWDFYDDGSLDDYGKTVTHSYDSAGTYTVVLKVTDSEGNVDREYRNIDVTESNPNTMPIIESIEPGTEITVEKGNSIDFTVYATDDDGNLSKVEWEIFINSGWQDIGTHSMSGSSDSDTCSYTFNETGDFQMTVEVFDTSYVTDYEYIDVHVQEGNNPPSASRDEPSDSEISVTKGEEVTFTIVASDSDGLLSEVEWYVNGFKQTTHSLSGSNDEDSCTENFEYVDTSTVKAIVFDDGGANSDPVSWTIIVEETHPERHWEVSNVGLNGNGMSITVSPGESVDVSLDYELWNDRNTSAIWQIPIGVEGNAKYCAYDGIPGGYPGASGSDTHTIQAPTSPGTYTLYANRTAQYSCGDALDSYEKNREIGTITVEETKRGNIKIEEFHPPEGKYEPKETVGLTFSVKETSGSGEIKFWPRLYIRGPFVDSNQYYSHIIDGNTHKIGAGKSYEGSLSWQIPEEAPSGSYHSSLLVYNPKTDEFVDNKHFGVPNFVVDTGESYFEIEPMDIPNLGKIRAMHIHWEDDELRVKNSAATVTNVEADNPFKFIKMLEVLKSTVGLGLSLEGVPTWLEVALKSKDAIESAIVFKEGTGVLVSGKDVLHSLITNADGSMDVLLLEVKSDLGIFYMNMGLNDLFSVLDDLISPEITDIPMNAGEESKAILERLRLLSPLPYVSMEGFPSSHYDTFEYPVGVIADTMLKGYHYIDGYMEEVPPHLNVWFKYSESKTNGLQLGVINQDGGTIPIFEHHGWNEDFVLRKYGYWVMYNAYSSPPNLNYGFDSKHSWSSIEKPSTAFAEGWSSFFSSAVLDDEKYRGYDAEGEYQVYNLESQWAKGLKNEGTVAGILWDIYDDADDGEDTLNAGFEPIWKVMEKKNPKNIKEFYQAWKDLGIEGSEKVRKIMNNHNVWPQSSVATSTDVNATDTTTETFDSSVETKIKKVEEDSPSLPGRVIIEVSSEVEEGKTIVFNIDENTISYSDSEEVAVLYDGKEIGMAGDYGDILNPESEENPEYLVVMGSEGVQILVSVPKFSTHEIVITKQAEFRIGDLVIDDKEITSGESTTVSIDVTNTGGIEDNYVAKLVVARETVDTKQVSVKPGEKKTVPFEVSETEPGTYQVKVGDHTGSFKVKPEIVSPWQIGVIVLIVALVIIGIAVGRKK